MSTYPELLLALLLYPNLLRSVEKMYKRQLTWLLVILMMVSSIIPVLADTGQKVGEDMASLNLYGQNAYGCEATISALQYPFDWDHYNAVVITDGSTVNGSTTDPSGTYYGYNVPNVQTGTTRAAYLTVEGLNPETSYTLRAYAQTIADGKWWACGSDTIKTLPEYTPPPPEYQYPSSMQLIGSNTARFNFVKGEGSTYTEVYWTDTNEEPDYWAAYKARTTSLNSITVYDLPYNSNVAFFIRARTNGVASEWVYADFIDTISPPAPTPPVILSRFDGGVTVQCGNVSLANYYFKEYRKSGTSTWYTAEEIISPSATISGLEYGTAYEFRAKTDLSDTYSSINVGTTSPQKPVISVTGITYDAITVRVNALANNCDRVKVECYEINGTLAQTKWIDPAGRTFPQSSTSFTGLNRNFSYFFIATSYYDAGGDGTGTGTWLESVPSDRVDATTLNRPNNWAWSYSMVSGGNVYQSSYNTSTGVLTAYIMPYTEWNNFTARINDFRTYKGLTQYAFTQATSGSGVTPAIVNQAIDAINPMLEVANRISNVTAGDISASTFNTMRDRLNSL